MVVHNLEGSLVEHKDLEMAGIPVADHNLAAVMSFVGLRTVLRSTRLSHQAAHIAMEETQLLLTLKEGRCLDHIAKGERCFGHTWRKAG